MTSSLFAIFGPPGTGKTRRLSEDASRAATTYGPERVMICSLTRTAAAEIRSRVNVPDRNVGTLHSFCYRALGAPGLAQSREHVAAWNEKHPHWPITPSDDAGGEKGLDGQLEDRGTERPGDAALAEIGLNRHTLLDGRLWRPELLNFHVAWEEWKRSLGLIDFTDMIDQARTEVRVPPGNAAVLIVDEAQDLSKLEMDVIRNWSRHARTTLLAGDADQWLYEWRGAYPEVFKPGGLPREQTRFLSQSYRVPVAAHAKAQEIIRGCENRVDVEYRPTKVAGSVECGIDSFKHPHGLVDLAIEHTKRPELGSLMLIAPCNFSLGPLIAKLRGAGVPFHNPYRKTAGHWNPLGKRKGISTPQRLLAFTRLARTGQPWSTDDFRMWASALQSEGVFVRGTKKWLDDDYFRAPQTRDELVSMFTSEGHAAACVRGDLYWYEQHCLSAMSKRLEYPRRVMDEFGAVALERPPAVTIGTIHSVKGGEADVVAVSPDLSPAGVEEMDHNPDYVRRLMYVACTRTRRDLILCRPSKGRTGMDAGLW